MVACERHRLSFETFDLVFGTNVIIYYSYVYCFKSLPLSFLLHYIHVHPELTTRPNFFLCNTFKLRSNLVTGRKSHYFPELSLAKLTQINV